MCDIIKNLKKNKNNAKYVPIKIAKHYYCAKHYHFIYFCYKSSNTYIVGIEHEFIITVTDHKIPFFYHINRIKHLRQKRLAIKHEKLCLS